MYLESLHVVVHVNQDFCSPLLSNKDSETILQYLVLCLTIYNFFHITVSYKILTPTILILLHLHAIQSLHTTK